MHLISGQIFQQPGVTKVLISMELINQFPYWIDGETLVMLPQHKVFREFPLALQLDSITNATFLLVVR